MNKEMIEKIKLMLINFKINYDYQNYYNEEDILENIAALESLQNPDYEAIAERMIHWIEVNHLALQKMAVFGYCKKEYKQAIIKILKESV